MSKQERPAFDRIHWLYNAYMLITNRYKIDTITDMVGFKGDEKVVDIGGGTGYVARHIAPLCREVYIIDQSPLMLGHAEESLGMRAIAGDALATPFEDDEFDVALLTDVLHHIKDQPKLVKEAHRILKTGGRLYIHDSDASHWQVPIASFFEEIFAGKVYKQTLEYAEELFRSTGFEQLKKRIRGKQYFILWRKK
ncbi:methyltransferase domain-containing protein [candidate division WOR-3 bacterium]|uniref:Methyltransferase domain-containing protein n=1 Tax=candidate division WOR-3 bacterium TaxID=2052148 RepID=A0A9D5K8I9_UNCW3|nr:methyltransferase domain-containing protein [candidate division WOR-3 bacterium]MBD3364306.1 methyltransferase domain-containing protein [candidate division WOR-3 bacterium]